MKDKIIEWLNDQGYPLEFRVANEFRKNGFTVVQSEYYTDPETNQNREIDVVAYKQVNTPNLLIRYTFVVECKSGQKKPWLLFSSPYNNLKDGRKVILNPATKIGKILLNESSLFSKYGDLDIFCVDDKTSFGLTQCFTSGKDIPYIALTNVAKATAAIIDKETNSTDLNISDVIFPFIVIEAPLFQSFYNNEIQLDEVESGTLLWRNRIINQQETIYRIQRFEYFKHKLESYSNNVDTLLKFCQQNINEIEKLVRETTQRYHIY